MTRGRAAAGALLGLAAALGMAAASQAPWPAETPEHAVLRLSWRTRGERVEECRRLSDAEVAALPAHMRRTEVCEGRVLPYRLRVEVDGRLIADETVAPAGARGDRPLYVFREVALAPGAHRVAVRFVREDAGRAGGAPGDGPGAAAPARLVLDETARLGAGEVLLVTYDEERRALVARRPAPGTNP